MEAANNRLLKLIAGALEGVSIEDAGIDPSTGATRLAIHGSAGSWQLSALWVGEGWPADVRNAFERLPPGPLPPELVLTARQFSPGALELLEERRANWVDESGNGRIDGPGLFLIRRTAAAVQAPRSTFSWSPSAIATAEALLARDWSAGVGTTELATLAHHSPAQVSQVLQAFDEKGWTVKYGPKRGPNARRELVDSEDLLDSWSRFLAEQEREPRLTHRTLRSPLDFLHGELSQALDREVRWAFSGWAAAHELAPLADTVPSLQIYVHEDDIAGPLDRAIKGAGLSDVAEGGRVAFFPAGDSALTLAQRGRAGPIVSTPRVYADLLALGGRGADAAVHLRDEALGNIHPTAGQREAPSGLVAWEQECRDRLEALAEGQPDLADLYRLGTWSASYRLLGIAEQPDLRRFVAIMREARGHETGWPPWLMPDRSEAGPRPVGGLVECWFSETVFGDAAHADFWRADPEGRLCLIRGFQEDSTRHPMAPKPGVGLDLTLPIWRAGECLLHAERLAHRLDATGIQFMLRWRGLEGRKLAALADNGWMMPPTGPASEDEVTSYVEIRPEEVQARLPEIVRTLLDPLYTDFDFFEPPAGIFEQELAKMRAGTADA